MDTSHYYMCRVVNAHIRKNTVVWIRTVTLKENTTILFFLKRMLCWFHWFVYLHNQLSVNYALINYLYLSSTPLPWQFLH